MQCFISFVYTYEHFSICMYLHKLIIDKSTGYRNNLYIEYMGVCVAIIISVQYTDFLVFRLIEFMATIMNFPRYFRVPKHFDLLCYATVNDKCLLHWLGASYKRQQGQLSPLKWLKWITLISNMEKHTYIHIYVCNYVCVNVISMCKMGWSCLASPLGYAEYITRNSASKTRLFNYVGSIIVR